MRAERGGGNEARSIARQVGRWSGRVVVAATAVLVTGSGSVLAHIIPDPSEAQAGSDQSIGFTVEHGCDGSPTVQLDMRVPDGASNIVPEPAEGWSATVDGQVVTFVGGPLPDDVELTFRVRMLLPATPDVTIYFPFVQRCEVGEIRWIDLPTDGTDTELDEPAPALQLFGPVAAPPSTTVAPGPTAPPTTAAAPTTPAPPANALTTPTSPTTTAAATTEAVTTEAPPTSVPDTDITLIAAPDSPEEGADDNDDDNGVNGLLIAALGAGGIAVAAGAVYAVRRRSPS